MAAAVRSSTRLRATPTNAGSILTNSPTAAPAEAEDREVDPEHHARPASAFKGTGGGGLTRAKDAAIKAGAEPGSAALRSPRRGDGSTADDLPRVWFALRRHGADPVRCKMTGEASVRRTRRRLLFEPMDAGRTECACFCENRSAVASSRDLSL